MAAGSRHATSGQSSSSAAADCAMGFHQPRTRAIVSFASSSSVNLSRTAARLASRRKARYAASAARFAIVPSCWSFASSPPPPPRFIPRQEILSVSRLSRLRHPRLPHRLQPTSCDPDPRNPLRKRRKHASPWFRQRYSWRRRRSAVCDHRQSRRQSPKVFHSP